MTELAHVSEYKVSLWRLVASYTIRLFLLGFLDVHPSFHPSTNPSIHLSIHISIYMSILLSIGSYQIGSFLILATMNVF